MRNVVSAEWTKLLPHKATWFLVWIYPILLTVILTIGIFVALGRGDADDAKRVVTATAWMGNSTAIWNTPTVSLGRYLIAAYIGLAFAGEYGWNTWKLVVPHVARWKLTASKYVVTIGLLYAAWLLAAVIAVVLAFVQAAVTGVAVPAGVSPSGIFDAHFAIFKIGLAPVLLTAAYASLVAILTRSALAAFIISLVLITLDEVFGKLVSWLSAFGMGWLAVPYRVLPGYHLENVTNWVQGLPAYQLRLATGDMVSFAQGTSLVVLAAWILGMISATFWVFRRQDIN